MNPVVQSAVEFGGAVLGGNAFATLFFWIVLICGFSLVGLLIVGVAVWLFLRYRKSATVQSVAASLIPESLFVPHESDSAGPSDDAIAYKLSMLDATEMLPGDVARKVVRESKTEIDALRRTAQLQAVALQSKGITVPQGGAS